MIGPSQSGKTTGRHHPDPARLRRARRVHLDQARRAARDDGRAVRNRDGSGSSTPPATRRTSQGVETLRWSPLTCSQDWDGALLMARAMVDGAAVGAGSTDCDPLGTQGAGAACRDPARRRDQRTCRCARWSAGSPATTSTARLTGCASTPRRAAGARRADRGGEHRGARALLDLLRHRRRARRLHLTGSTRRRRGAELRRQPVRRLRRHRLHPRAGGEPADGRAAGVRAACRDPPRHLPGPRRRPAGRPGAVRAG